jgi:hypothetical protein
MNLGKLLSASTSFFGGGDKAAYRLSKGGSLPRFNEGRNPFGYRPALETPALTAPVPAVRPVQKAPPPYAFKPAVKVAARTVAQAESKPARQGWTTRLNPFRAPEPAVAQAVPAVQAELSLDSVKVVHNDLADADVEVVPVKSRTDASGTAPVLPPSRRTWGLFAENLVKS